MKKEKTVQQKRAGTALVHSASLPRVSVTINVTLHILIIRDTSSRSSGMSHSFLPGDLLLQQGIAILAQTKTIALDVEPDRVQVALFAIGRPELGDDDCGALTATLWAQKIRRWIAITTKTLKGLMPE